MNQILGSVRTTALPAIPKNVSLHSVVLPSLIEPKNSPGIFWTFGTSWPLSVSLQASPKLPLGSSKVTLPLLSRLTLKLGEIVSDLFAEAIPDRNDTLEATTAATSSPIRIRMMPPGHADACAWRWFSSADSRDPLSSNLGGRLRTDSPSAEREFAATRQSINRKKAKPSASNSQAAGPCRAATSGRCCRRARGWRDRPARTAAAARASSRRRRAGTAAVRAASPNATTGAAAVADRPSLARRLTRQ